VPLALHGVAFEALHEALEHPAWTEESLGRLQVRLGQFDDLKNLEQAISCEILSMFGMLAWFRSHAHEFDFSSDAPNFFNFAWKHGPIGWHDANIAFYADCMLELLGPPEREAWMSGHARSANVRQRASAAYTWPNPRRMLGTIAIPNVGRLSESIAEALFHRRCLIIACALEKHRMRHGAFPASLEAVREDVRLFTLDDPARPGHLPGFRLENGGYLLWSAGPDAKDDGGHKDDDWLWRIKREP